MDQSTRRILLGATASAVGALLGMAFWHAVVPRHLRSTTVRAASSSSRPGVRNSTSAAEREFQTIGKQIQTDVKGSADRKAAARRAVDPLQRFIAKYPTDPVTDKARLNLGNMQLLMGDASAAMATFRAVAEQPRDAAMAPIALFFLGRLQAAKGQYADAEASFHKLQAQAKDARYAAVAKAALALLAARPGQPPPAFLMRDLQGHSQSPDQYRGKVLLLDFWATWCGPCRAEMPHLKRLYERYHDRGLAIVGVSLDTNPNALRHFVAEEGIAWPQLFDGRGPHGELPRRMGVISIPKMFLIDRQGTIRSVSGGGPALETAVQELFKAQRAG
jgi:thiol-disulfide isomerase/thioredoxin